jgi:hypothetical protein
MGEGPCQEINEDNYDFQNGDKPIGMPFGKVRSFHDGY